MRLAHLQEFYHHLNVLAEQTGGPKTLGHCTGRMVWPRRGVYFFMELGEVRTQSGSGPRVVRVGTHALTAGSGTKLWTRLSQHRGPGRTGGGNHRGSIFRLLVGTALIARDGRDSLVWGERVGATHDHRLLETDLEKEVSAVIRAMPFICLGVDDEPGAESKRGFVERSAIALLSNAGKPPLDPASPDWLGHHCNRERVRRSGLWNQNHVDEDYDPRFLKVLEELVRASEAAR